MSQKIQVRRGTNAERLTVRLDVGELCYAVDTGLTYIGDGATLGGRLMVSSTSYLVYRALLTQAGTAAPVATVLENTLGGTVVWTRNGQGYYYGTLAGAFPTSKVWCGKPSLDLDNIVNIEYFGSLSNHPPNFVALSIQDSTFTTTDNFNDCAIEILVYP